MDLPIINLHSDDFFMGQALREARKAYAAGEVIATTERAQRIVCVVEHGVAEIFATGCLPLRRTRTKATIAASARNSSVRFLSFLSMGF